MTRDITEDQARVVLRILIEECGHRVFDPRDGDALVHGIMVPPKYKTEPCREWRFCGALGFGGKFRNNGNRDSTPYVDCYREDETPARLAMIETANRRLVELFAPAATGRPT